MKQPETASPKSAVGAPGRYGVIGNPIVHSKSPIIHDAFARQTGVSLHYDRIYAGLDRFDETVRAFIAAGGRGLNVTVPFKLDAHAISTRLSLRAESAGAVNTLVFRGTGIFGDNTDGIGLVRDLIYNLGHSLARARVLLLGAGGAARGALLPLLEARPARIFIANRTADRAVVLAQRFEAAARLHQVDLIGSGYDSLSPGAGYAFDLIINATTGSLQAQVPPIRPAVFAPGALAYDMMYSAQPTVFMQFARQHGAQAWDGLGMLVEQAAESFFIWHGVRPNASPVLQTLRAALQVEAEAALRARR